MRYAMLWVAAVAWGLWVGGTIAVFVFGYYLFHHLPLETFRPAGNAMFAVFANYQLALAGVGIATAGLAFVTYPSRWTLGLLAAFIAAGITSVVFGLALLPMMDGLRQQGMVDTPQWRQLHGQSMATLAVQAVILLGGGAMLLGATARRPKATVAPARFEVVPAS